MPQIRIDTEQVASTGQQFNAKRGELESLVNQSRALMNNLQGQFTGRRATAISPLRRSRSRTPMGHVRPPFSIFCVCRNPFWKHRRATNHVFD